MLKEIANRWEAQQRIRFIEERLFWTGRINRKEIVEFFGITNAHASSDLTLYQDLAPANMAYDMSGRTYRIQEDFKPLFGSHSFKTFLGRRLVNDGFLPDLSFMETLPFPTRAADPKVIRKVLGAIREGWRIKIRYQSLSTPEPTWRWISPHALAHDGYRWHIRAWCEKRENFRDFVLGRILSVAKGQGKRFIDPAKDTAWKETVDVKIGPHPALSHEQEAVVSLDYGMKNGIAKMTVRRAMLLYALAHLRLDTDNHKPPAVQICLLNPEIRALFTDISIQENIPTPDG